MTCHRQIVWTTYNILILEIIFNSLVSTLNFKVSFSLCLPSLLSRSFCFRYQAARLKTRPTANCVCVCVHVWAGSICVCMKKDLCTFWFSESESECCSLSSSSIHPHTHNNSTGCLRDHWLFGLFSLFCPQKFSIQFRVGRDFIQSHSRLVNSCDVTHLIICQFSRFFKDNVSMVSSRGRNWHKIRHHSLHRSISISMMFLPLRRESFNFEFEVNLT